VQCAVPVIVNIHMNFVTRIIFFDKILFKMSLSKKSPFNLYRLRYGPDLDDKNDPDLPHCVFTEMFTDVEYTQ
jgi:hypothetical protein